MTAAVCLILPTGERGPQLDRLTRVAAEHHLEIVAVTYDLAAAVALIVDGTATKLLAVSGDVLGQILEQAGGEFISPFTPSPQTDRRPRRRISPVPRRDRSGDARTTPVRASAGGGRS
ncbi:hypothetical protein ABZS66_37300 [Dactylosporangium sp. NPDC005572]|uniref:hypothetical protein n=1 Tax=Dactylosporangium sp. NPDC005572 TaxID=3156889 RepID=UPI00339FBEA4